MSPALLFILILVGIAGCLAFWAWRARTGMSPAPARWLVIGASVGALALGLTSIWFAKVDQAPLRVSLEALDFSPDGLRVISAGGDPTADELVVPSAKGELFNVTREASQVVLSANYGGDAGRPFIVQARGRVLGAIPLPEDAEFCLAPCQPDDHAPFRLVRTERDGKMETRLVTVAGPAKEGRVMRPLKGSPSALTDLGAYPLTLYAPEPARFTSGEGVRSLIYGNPEGELFFVQLDDKVRMTSKAGAVAAPELILTEGKDKAPFSVGIHLIEVMESGDGRLQDRRSFNISGSAAGPLRFRLDTPQTVTLEAADLDAEEDRLGENRDPIIKLSSAAATAPPVNPQHSTLEFRLGGAFSGMDVALDFRSRPFKLSKGGETTMSAVSVTTPNGGTVALGDKQKAIVRITAYDGGWHVLSAATFVLLVGGAASIFATWRLRSESSVGLAVFSMLDVMLVMRVLASIQAASFDVSLKAQAAPAAGLVGFLIGPLILSLAGRSTYETPFRLLAHGVAVAVLVMWTDRFVGPVGAAYPGAAPGEMYMPAILAIAAAIIIAGLCAADRLLRRGKPSLAGYCLTAVDKALDLRAPAKLNHWWWWLAAAVMIAVVRQYVVGPFVQEREGIPLSLVYVPVALVLFAYFLDRWRIAPPGGKSWSEQSPWGASIAFCAGLFLIYVFGVWLAAFFGGFVRDFGSIIFALPVLVAGWLVLDPTVGGSVKPKPIYARLWPPRYPLMWLPAFVAAALLLAANILPPLFAPTKSPAAVTTIEQAREVLQGASLWYDQDLARLFGKFDPAGAAQAGTKSGEIIATLMANMEDHARHLVGPGLLGSEPPIGLAANHMDDNVASVHILGPFGRMGAAALSLMLMAAVALAMASQARVKPALDGGRILGLLALGTFASVSVYMIMVHTLAAIFVGRNVYLMSIASVGDFAEGLVLLALGLFLLTRRVA